MRLRTNHAEPRDRPPRRTAIRIMVIEDHPAMRAGLTGVLTAEPQLVLLAAAACADEIMPALQRARPDVVLLDYHLPGGDGLAVCAMLKQEAAAPAVLLYSAFASGMAVDGSGPAVIARALCTTPAAICARIDEMIERLKVSVPEASW